nr:hypothetical protein [Microthrixaceae bacterium]
MSAHRRSVLASVLVALVLAAVGLGAFGGSASASGGRGSAPGPRRVLVVTFPRLTWDAVSRDEPPELTRFLERSAVASLSTRTVGPRTDGADAYLTLGAGNRADAANPLTAGDAAQLAETTPSGSAAQVYQRRTGIEPTGE